MKFILRIDIKKNFESFIQRFFLTREHLQARRKLLNIGGAYDFWGTLRLQSLNDEGARRYFFLHIKKYWGSAPSSYDPVLIMGSVEAYVLLHT